MDEITINPNLAVEMRKLAMSKSEPKPISEDLQTFIDQHPEFFIYHRRQIKHFASGGCFEYIIPMRDISPEYYALIIQYFELCGFKVSQNPYTYGYVEFVLNWKTL